MTKVETLVEKGFTNKRLSSVKIFGCGEQCHIPSRHTTLKIVTFKGGHLMW